MQERTKPPFRADHVGSLIRPDALIKAREQAEKKEISDAELRRIQQAAIRDVVRMQEELGLKLVTDGEYNRHSWHRDFMLKFGNVQMMPSKLTVRFHTAEGERLHSPPTMQVTGKLARPDGGGIFVDDFKFLVSIARAMPKITHPVADRDAFPRRARGDRCRAYPDIAAFYDDLARLYREEIADLAQAGCRYLQIDEVNLAYLCDPELRQQVANIGEDPGHAAEDLRQAAQRHHQGSPAGHDGVHASVPRQFRRRLGGGRRLRADRGAAVQRDRDRRLFPGIRQRARRRLRAAALPAQGQDRRARPGHHQERRARKQGRAQAPHRGGGEARPARAAGAFTRNAASPAASAATPWTSRARSPSSRLVVETAREVWGRASRAARLCSFAGRTECRVCEAAVRIRDNSSGRSSVQEQVATRTETEPAVRARIHS